MQITLEQMHNEEARAELIDAIVGMLVAGHVPMLLDFVPVAERLPKNPG